MPARQFADEAVDDQRQRGPAVLSCPDPIHVRRPALIRPGRDRRDCLDPRTHADRTPANLPSLELKYPLDRVLVEPQEPGHGPVTERRFLLDHRLDGLGKARINLRNGFGGPVITVRRGTPNQAQRLVRGTLMPSARRPCWVLWIICRPPHPAGPGIFFARATPAWPHQASCGSFSCFAYCSRMSSGLARREFSIPRLASSTQPSISEGDRSNDRLASATVVWP